MDPSAVRQVPLPGSKGADLKGTCSNYISTTKYSIYSFLPLGLLYQFFRFSNCYFLFVTILQCIPIISPLGPETAVMPMIFVLFVSLLREGLEDYGRYVNDQGKF